MTTSPLNLTAFGEKLTHNFEVESAHPYGDPRSVDPKRLGELALPCASKGQDRSCLPGQAGCCFLRTMTQKQIQNSPTAIQTTLVNACGGEMLNSVLKVELEDAEKTNRINLGLMNKMAHDSEREKKQATEEAMLDSLTGLGGRGTLFQKYDSLIGFEAFESDFPPSNVALIFLDLNGLKEVNDTHGHVAGDDLLKAFANFIRSRITINDLAIKFGGDEFIVLMPNIAEEDLIKFLEDFKEGLKDSNNLEIVSILNKYELPEITTAIGYIHADLTEIGPVTREMLDDYIQQADDAMYDNKAEHKRIVRTRKDLRVISNDDPAISGKELYVDPVGRFLAPAA